MSTINVHLTARSSNAKTGPIPVSTTGAQTCPNSCPFKAGGCYAKGGPLAMHWRKVTEGDRGVAWGEFCQTIKALPDGQVWRHNQAGDLPGDGDDIDAGALWQLVQANGDSRGFTYTHYDVENNAGNADAVELANMYGFTVNLSANNLQHADTLAALDIAPVVVVLDAATSENTTTPDGRTVVVCPATQRDDVTCASCQLCQRQRDVIIGFPAHGSSKRKASAIATEE